MEFQVYQQIGLEKWVLHHVQVKIWNTIEMFYKLMMVLQYQKHLQVFHQIIGVKVFEWTLHFYIYLLVKHID